MMKSVSVGKDIFAGIVVFLVALPLCLGIAAACGVSPLAGLISGVLGGLLVTAVSRASLSVSGPAAGLVVIVVAGIAELGLPAFLTAMLLAGVLQIGLGLSGAGLLVKLVPGPVIKGMLAAIGLTLIVKQLPIAIGLSPAYAAIHAQDARWILDGSLFWQTPIGPLAPPAILIAVLSLAVLAGWESAWARRYRFARLIPGPMVAVCLGVALSWGLRLLSPALALPADYRVAIVPLASLQDLLLLLPRPDWQALSQPAVWRIAVVLAVVASLESLLCIEAVEQLDPLRRRVPVKRELVAQGLGNAAAALLGALPITSVIVRSSANVYAGGLTRLSSVVHGLLLLLGLFLLPGVLRLVPLACLAAILLQTGYKLAKPSLLRSMARSGWQQFLPFAATVSGVLATDLLIGILIGVTVSLALMLRAHLQRIVMLTQYDNSYLLVFRKDVSFLAKPHVARCLDRIPHGATLIIDAERADFIDRDILDMLQAYRVAAAERQITVETQNWPWSKPVDTLPA